MSDALQMPPPGQRITVNGLQLYYEVYGAGAPLVLLHGFFGSTRVWHSYIHALAEHFQLIVPDLRGHGRSTNPTHQFTHRQAARDIFALLDHLGIGQFTAIGISSGGMTLLHMATQQPARSEALVLIGATSHFPEQARAIMRERTVDSAAVDWDGLRQHHVHGDEQIRALLTQLHNFKDSYDDMNFTPPSLTTITAPTLIVHGDRDRHFPVAIPVALYTALLQAYLWIVPNGEHVPIEDEWANVFTQTAVDFLRGHWG